MFWIDLIWVFLFALVLSSILSWGFHWRHPAGGDAVGASFLFLFLILMLAMWAGAGWFRPGPPAEYHTPWLGLLLIGFFISLIILAAAAPVRKPRTPAEAREAAREEAAAATAFGLFFWILIVGLLIAVVVGYFI